MKPNKIFIIILSVIGSIFAIITIFLMIHYCRKRNSNLIEVNKELDKIGLLEPRQMV